MDDTKIPCSPCSYCLSVIEFNIRLHFFDPEPVGLVTFARHMVENAPAVVWQQCSSALPRLHCDDRGLIEEATGLLQVDFANRSVPGGER